MTKIFADNLLTPLITIAIPTYERLNYLKEAVASALFWKTSHGPQKSIITAPSETRKATGILPRAGGLSGFALTIGLFASGALGASDRPELAETSPMLQSATATIRRRISLLFSVILFQSSHLSVH
jgi:hypothetical protein